MDSEKYRELSTLSSESNMAYVYGFIKGIFQGLKDEVFEVVDRAKMALNFQDNGVSKVWKWLKGAAEFVVSLPDKVRRLRDVDFGDILNAIKGVFSAIGNAISGMSNEDKGKALGYLIGGFLGDKIKGPLGAFGNALGGGPMGKFLKMMGNLSDAAFSAVSSSITKLVDKIKGMFGISSGQVAALDDRLFKVLAKNGCFVAGTLVLTESGYKAIETVGVGERVYSRNIETGATELKTVYSTFSGLKAKFYKLHVAGEVIEAKEEHPFWVSGYGWMTAKELKAGMQLVRKTGILEEIELITSYETSGTPIYNLAVADNHNYFVTRSNLLTHNLDCKKFNILYDSSGQLIKENLDALLAQVRSGKVTDAEYREIRELLVATKRNEKAVESLDNAMDAVKGAGKLVYKSDFADHLRNVQKFNRDASKGITGGHNMDEFYNYFRKVENLDDADFIHKITEHPTIDGISQIEYKIPKLDNKGNLTGEYKYFKNPKTVYDPSKISDNVIQEWGKAAMQDGIDAGNIVGRKITGTAPNGLKFEGYMDADGVITNFYPKLN